MKIRYLMIIFILIPIIIYGIHSVHVVPKFWKYPFYLTLLLDLVLILAGFLILKTSDKTILLNSKKRELWLRILTAWVMIWIFLWVFIPLTMYNFVIEYPEKEISITNRTFHLYSFGHKRNSQTIIYEQKNNWLMTKIGEFPYSFELFDLNIKDDKILFLVNQKVIKSIPIDNKF